MMKLEKEERMKISFRLSDSFFPFIPFSFFPFCKTSLAMYGQHSGLQSLFSLFLCFVRSRAAIWERKKEWSRRLEKNEKEKKKRPRASLELLARVEYLTLVSYDLLSSPVYYGVVS